MVKLAVLLKRRAAMSFEHFDRYWDGTHMVTAFNEAKFMENIAPDDEMFVERATTQLFTLREIEKFPLKCRIYDD